MLFRSIAAGGGNAFFRAVIAAIVLLSITGLIVVQIGSARGAGEMLLWVLLGIEIALALLTLFSLVIYGWIPVVLTMLAIQWWPRRPRERAITGLHLLVQLLAFLVVLAPFIVPR